MNVTRFRDLSDDFQDVHFQAMLYYTRWIPSGASTAEWLYFMEDIRDALMMGCEL